jgi:hypothetical protein
MLWAGCPRKHSLTAGRGKRFFSFPKCPDCLWGPLSLLLNGNKGFFTERQSGQGVKLTNHLHLVPRLRMRGTIPELPPHAFMAVTGTTLSLPLILLISYAIPWMHGVVWVKNSFRIFFFQFPFLNPDILPITLFLSVLWQMTYLLASRTMQRHKMTIIIFFHTLLTSLIANECYINWINNTMLLNKPPGKYCLSCISPVFYRPSCRAILRCVIPVVSGTII